MDLARVSAEAPPADALPLHVDDDAIARAASADATAFAELYVRHRDAVFGYLRARTQSDDDALELTAVTFERAIAAVGRYRPRGAGFRAWLFRIARNAAVDENRRQRRTVSLPGPADIDAEPVDRRADPEAEALLHEDLRRLRAAFAELGDDQRDAIGLRFGAGLKAREIGAVIDKHEAAVQKLIERAIERLREVMA